MKKRLKQRAKALGILGLKSKVTTGRYAGSVLSDLISVNPKYVHFMVERKLWQLTHKAWLEMWASLAKYAPAPDQDEGDFDRLEDDAWLMQSLDSEWV